MSNNLIDQLKAKVLSSLPALQQIYNTHQSESVFDYVNSWPIGPFLPQTEAFGRVLKPALSKLYGSNIALQAAAEFQAKPLLSTVDHLGLLNHPFFINSNLIFSLRSQQKFLIVLATGGVSLNNSSWPGCLVRTQGAEKLKRYSLFPDRIKTHPVLSAPAFLPEQVDHLSKGIQTDNSLSQFQRDRLLDVTQRIFSDDQIFAQAKFADQACLVSFCLWQEIFPGAPRVLYLPIESVINGLLVQEILPQANHLLTQLLTTEQGWQLIEKYFAGSLGAFSESRKGSFLFWGCQASGKRDHLYRQGDKLVGENMEISLTATDLIDNLKNGQLYPTTLLSFFLLFYYGITAVGGFNQTTWLSEAKNKFQQLLAELGENNLAQNLHSLPTANFAESGLAFLLHNNLPFCASGLDIILSEVQKPWERYVVLAKSLKLGQSIESRLPEIYRVVTQANHLDQSLSTVSDLEILKMLSLQDKIQACLFDK